MLESNNIISIWQDIKEYYKSQMDKDNSGNTSAHPVLQVRWQSGNKSQSGFFGFFND
jgi:hypothetical protein